MVHRNEEGCRVGRGIEWDGQAVGMDREWGWTESGGGQRVVGWTESGGGGE